MDVSSSLTGGRWMVCKLMRPPVLCVSLTGLRGLQEERRREGRPRKGQTGRLCTALLGGGGGGSDGRAGRSGVLAAEGLSAHPAWMQSQR